MRVLVIVGECIQVNTSSNLCNLAYLRGLLASGNQVTLLSADKHGYSIDPNLIIPAEVKSYTYRSMTLYERLSISLKGKKTEPSRLTGVESSKSKPRKKSLIRKLKKAVFSIYGPHGVYSKFAFCACSYHEKAEYDLVISLSNPPSSHLLAYRLLKWKRIKSKRWIQIWEDPWYGDVDRGRKTEQILREERRLLSVADRICYVSPITLQYQKKMFPESAGKMTWAPLPAYYEELKCSNPIKGNEPLFGYFGEYYLPARNLQPFYEAACATEASVNICGNSNIRLRNTEKIRVYPRLNLNELRPIEQSTDVLVFLCNSKGGQIPGKIYQYAATRKTILFILDGTEEEKEILKSFFEPFHRFIFCENMQESIAEAISRIRNGELGDVYNVPLKEFSPEKIVERVLEEGMR